MHVLLIACINSTLGARITRAPLSVKSDATRAQMRRMRLSNKVATLPYGG